PGLLIGLLLVRVLKAQVLPRAQIEFPDGLEARNAFLAKPEVMTHALVHEAAEGEGGLRPGGNLRVIGEFELQGTFPIGLDGGRAELELAVWTRRKRQSGPRFEVRVEIIGACLSSVTKQTPLPRSGLLGRRRSPLRPVAPRHGGPSLASDLRCLDAFDVAG